MYRFIRKNIIFPTVTDPPPLLYTGGGLIAPNHIFHGCCTMHNADAIVIPSNNIMK